MKALIKSKFTLLVFTSLFISFQMQSQEASLDKKQKSEIKVDVFDLAVFTALEVTYEKLKDDESGYGLTLYLNFRSEDTFYEKFALTTFYRFYFLNGKDYGAKGFFSESFLKYSSGENFEIDFYNSENTNYSDLSLGFAIGRKWVSKKGFTMETSIGIGRNFGLDKNSPDFAIRGGISLGYRF